MASFVQRYSFVTDPPPHPTTAKHVRPRLSRYVKRKAGRR
ncbi:hypothetical protein NXF25_005876 [Crotalus adamanteus]|uniref:Uncharacterized protein n=1 Tax=Crotalus adamanteus TaxID=8729 RepID=A0AAW1BZU5_CROAD